MDKAASPAFKVLWGLNWVVVGVVVGAGVLSLFGLNVSAWWFVLFFPLYAVFPMAVEVRNFRRGDFWGKVKSVTLLLVWLAFVAACFMEYPGILRRHWFD